MLTRSPAWLGALVVTVITAVLVVLDISDRSVRRFWSRDAFTSSVLAGVLVLLLTVLIVDRVVARRQLKNQSRAMAAQVAVIVAQAGRAADVVSRASRSDEDREQAADELRTYAQMLLVSAPLLIGAEIPRMFLEAAQHLAGQLFRIVRAAEAKKGKHDEIRVDDSVKRLRETAAPLLNVLNRQERAAATSSDGVATGTEE